MDSVQLRLPLKHHVDFPRPTTPLDVRQRLSQLLEQDLTFEEHKTNYATHNLHAFAAKFPPHLPQIFIHELTQPGQCVLDPMVGSGTTLVEAVMAGRDAIGMDLDPLAVLIAHVKSSRSDMVYFVQASQLVLQRARQIWRTFDRQLLGRTYTEQAVEFFDYWFAPHTIGELFSLVQAIHTVEHDGVRALLQAVFSSIIITKSGGLTLARDLAHSRPHRDLTRKVTVSAFEVFQERLSAVCKQVEIMLDTTSHAVVIQTDARSIPLASNSVDLIVTSPPYAANAIDYMRAHKFSLIWFGYQPKTLSLLRSRYLGAELKSAAHEVASEMGNRVLMEMRQVDERRAAVVAHYYEDMRIVLQEMRRVLAPERAAVLVVGSSNIRGIDIQVPTVLSEIAVEIGFDLVGIAKRQIVRNARMMPVSHGSARDGIEARMHEEGVIGLVKPVSGNLNADAG